MGDKDRRERENQARIGLTNEAEVVVDTAAKSTNLGARLASGITIFNVCIYSSDGFNLLA
jgi:hypothetical protein